MFRKEKSLKCLKTKRHFKSIKKFSNEKSFKTKNVVKPISL